MDRGTVGAVAQGAGGCGCKKGAGGEAGGGSGGACCVLYRAACTLVYAVMCLCHLLTVVCFAKSHQLQELCSPVW